MGRAALILIVSLAVSFGYISNSIRSTMNALTASMSSYNQYAIARDLARTAVHTTLRAIDRGIAVPTSGSFGYGSFTVSTHTTADTLWMTTIGTCQDSSYRMDLKLEMSTKPFFEPGGAMAINASITKFKVNGQPTIDGRDHPISATDENDTTGSGNLPGITVRDAVDTADINSQTSLNLLGSPKLAVNSSTPDPAPFINEYYQSADPGYIINVGDPLPPSPWGTIDAPRIVFLDAGADTAAITISGTYTGCGILVVRGNIKITGNFTFIGLLVVDGVTNVLDFTAAGNCSIVGGTIMTGNAVDVTISGTASKGKMLYSSEALDKAKNIGRLRFYRVMEWYE